MSTVAKVTTFSSSRFPGWVWGLESSLAISVSYYDKQNPIALCKTAHIYYCSQVYRSSGWFFRSRPGLTGFNWTHSCTYGQMDGIGWPWLEELTQWGLFPRISHISPAGLFIEQHQDSDWVGEVGEEVRRGEEKRGGERFASFLRLKLQTGTLSLLLPSTGQSKS